MFDDDSVRAEAISLVMKLSVQMGATRLKRSEGEKKIVRTRTELSIRTATDH